MRTDVGREREVALYEQEPLREVVANPRQEEIVLVRAACVPFAAAKQHVAVENKGRLGAANGQACLVRLAGSLAVRGKSR